MRHPAAVAAIAAIGLAPIVASAQEPDARSRAYCDSALRSVKVDTFPMLVTAAVHGVNGRRFPSPYDGLILQEVAARFHAPDPFVALVHGTDAELSLMATREIRGLPPRPGIARSNDNSAAADSLRRLTIPSPQRARAPRYPTVRGEYALHYRRDGTVDRVTVVTASLVPGLDSAIATAIDAASREHALPILLADIPADTVVLHLVVDGRQAPDEEHRPLLRAVVPRFNIRGPRADPTAEGPIYPTDERLAGRSGYVLAEFVITPAGRVMPGATSILYATSDAFGGAVTRWLDAAEFEPARVEACALTELVRMGFDFRIPD